MNNTIKVYNIPKNPNIIKGHIYALYINNNTNLDLSHLINTKKVNISTPKKATNSIVISEQDYTRLLELNNIMYQLTNQRTINIQKFISEETKISTELTKINLERQNLAKKLTKGKE